MEATPFFNNIVVKRVSGQCILDALEFGVSKHPNSAGSFPQVSGISFDIDTSLNSTVETDSQGQFLNVKGKRKVSNVKINGEDLDLNRIYNVSLNEFVANGGDGYFMFTKYEVFYEPLYTDTDSLAYYIKNNLNGRIPAEYKDFQGRINFVIGSEVPSTKVHNIEVPSTEVPITEVPSDSYSGYIKYTKKSGGLSTGDILTILIPLMIAIL